MDTEIEAILVTFIRENCLPQKVQMTLGKEDNLFDTGTIDSAGLIHFIGFIEDRFNIVIPDEDLIPEKFTTIASITAYVRARIHESAIESLR
ncbi:MAG: acyl carrier protein [Bacteroidetes bacterium]|nr:acyl carrier protein [Bacteroidota bacterium]